MSALFIAGAAGDEADSGKRNYAGAETWELLNMRNVINSITASAMLTTSRNSNLAIGPNSRTSRRFCKA